MNERLDMESELSKLHGDAILFISMKILDGASPLSVAAVLASQAMTLYKTLLDEEDYEKMMLAMYNSRQVVKKIELPDITLN